MSKGKRPALPCKPLGLDLDISHALSPVVGGHYVDAGHIAGKRGGVGPAPVKLGGYIVFPSASCLVCLSH
jgi:hypothetical protein